MLNVKDGQEEKSRLAIDDELKVLEALETPGATIMKVADQLNIIKSHVRRIKQSKE